MKTGYIIGIIIAIVVVAGGVFAFTKKDKTETPANTSSPGTSSNSSTGKTTTPSTKADTTAETPSATENTISYNGSAFSPASMTVKAGTTLTIKNNSSDALQLNSDPHPVHTDNPELNVGLVNPGESKTFTVSKTGTSGYHNHFSPFQKGTLIIE